jgi:putative endopeptidase
MCLKRQNKRYQKIQSPLISGINKQNMDLTIKTSDDFFTYVNGT